MVTRCGSHSARPARDNTSALYSHILICRVEVCPATSAVRIPRHTEREPAAPAGDHVRPRGHALRVMRLSTPAPRRSQSVVGTSVVVARRAAAMVGSSARRGAASEPADLGDLCAPPAPGSKALGVSARITRPTPADHARPSSWLEEPVSRRSARAARAKAAQSSRSGPAEQHHLAHCHRNLPAACRFTVSGPALASRG